MNRSALAVAITVVLSLACGGGAKKPAKPTVVHGTGEVVAVGEFEVEVHGSSRTRSVGNKFVNHAAPKGATLQIVDVSVKNTGAKPQGMLGRFQLVAGEVTYTPTGPCHFALKGSWNTLEQVNPGIRHRGKVCFEVPTDVEGLDFGFKSGLFAQPEHFALK